MVLGVGTDILRTRHIENCLAEEDRPFLEKVYTAVEREEAQGREVPLSYYATRFAGKEAVFKCFGEIPGEIRLNEIEILTHISGKPTVRLSGRSLAHAQSMGIQRIHLSLSYDGEYAVAFAVAEGGETEHVQ